MNNPLQSLRDRHLLAPRSLLQDSPWEDVLKDVRVTGYDVGARGGFDHLLLPIAGSVSWVGFEPDEAEIRRLEAEAKSAKPWGAKKYLPMALGRPSTDRTLYITKSPGCTSLLRPDPDVYRPYGREELFDVEREVTMATEGLDTVVASQGLEPPSYLKVDIQGADLEVLETGQAQLEHHVAGIRIEVEFQPLYENQPLFPDVNQFLVSRGFTLVDLHQPIHWFRRGSSNRWAYGKDRTLGDLIHADAIYLRAPERYPGGEDESEQQILHRVRGALVAFSLGRLAHGHAVLNPDPVRRYLALRWGIDLDSSMDALGHRMARFLAWKRRGTAMKLLIRGAGA